MFMPVPDADHTITPPRPAAVSMSPNVSLADSLFQIQGESRSLLEMSGDPR